MSARRKSEQSPESIPEPPLSCPHISFVQSRLRRIREWAEEHDASTVAVWAAEAWDDIENVRDINKTLRKAAKRNGAFSDNRG